MVYLQPACGLPGSIEASSYHLSFLPLCLYPYGNRHSVHGMALPESDLESGTEPTNQCGAGCIRRLVVSPQGASRDFS